MRYVLLLSLEARSWGDDAAHTLPQSFSLLAGRHSEFLFGGGAGSKPLSWRSRTLPGKVGTPRGTARERRRP